MELMRILHFANGLDTGNATLHTHLTVSRSRDLGNEKPDSERQGTHVSLDGQANAE